MKNATNFSKECPSCKKILYYKSIYYLNSSIKKNSLCQSCFAKERAKSKEYREKLSNGVKKSWIGADDRKKEQSQNSKSYWKNLSEEDRKLICKKMSENFNRSEDRIKNLKDIFLNQNLFA